MFKHFPTLMDRPDTGNVIAALIYEVIAFFSLPFLLLLILQGSTDNAKVVAAIEIFYHVINFAVALTIFREYLSEAAIGLWQSLKAMAATIWTSVGLIFIVALVLYNLFSSSYSILHLSAVGALPLTEVELFMLSQGVVLTYPSLGTLCMVVLAPIAVGCLYYGAVFAPVCYTKPILAYVAMAAFLVFPRYCNAATYWHPTEQMILLATQLPLHLIACRAYQKTDSILAPIAIHAIVNLISCLMLLFFSFLGRI